jgi:hypothetical protein
VVDTSDLTPYNLSGTVYEANGSNFYSTASIFAGIPFAQTSYLAAITPLPGSGFHNAFAISFGTDTSLTVGAGWDNVTGFGEPNGLPFIQGLANRKK